MKKTLLALIRFYQKHISSHTKACCRFYTTCSQYAFTAIERFGALKGCWLAICRLLKCQPFHPGGFDPVPEEFSFFRRKNRASKRR